MAFKDDLASRLATRVQLATDGHRPYFEAVRVSLPDSKVIDPVTKRKYQRKLGIERHKQRIESFS